MDGSITSFVGIDIAKRSLDVCILPEGKQLSLPYDTAGLKQLFSWLPDAGSCLIVVEATARRCNPVIRSFAQRLEAQGKPFKVIMTACMRKLLVILNTLVKTNSPWNPDYAK